MVRLVPGRHEAGRSTPLAENELYTAHPPPPADNNSCTVDKL